MSDPFPPVVVEMPAEIDLTNSEELPALVTAVCTPGVTVVIADLTTTRFCDSSGLRHLLYARDKAAAADVELRLAISPGSPVHRILELTGIERFMPVYPTLRQAADDGCQPPPGQP
jgi:anti-sigma B factor antagonist